MFPIISDIHIVATLISTHFFSRCEETIKSTHEYQNYHIHLNESHKLENKWKKKKKTTIQLARSFMPSICYVKQVMLMCHVMPVHFINIFIIGMQSLVSLFHTKNGSNHRQRQHVFLMWFYGFIWLPPYTRFFIDTLNEAFNHAQSSCKINFHRVAFIWFM